MSRACLGGSGWAAVPGYRASRTRQDPAEKWPPPDWTAGKVNWGQASGLRASSPLSAIKRALGPGMAGEVGPIATSSLGNVLRSCDMMRYLAVHVDPSIGSRPRGQARTLAPAGRLPRAYRRYCGIFLLYRLPSWASEQSLDETVGQDANHSPDDWGHCPSKSAPDLSILLSYFFLTPPSWQFIDPSKGNMLAGTPALP